LQLNINQFGVFGNRRWVHRDLHTADSGDSHDVIRDFLRLSDGSPRDNDVSRGFVRSVVCKVTNHLQARHFNAAEEYQEYQW